MKKLLFLQDPGASAGKAFAAAATELPSWQILAGDEPDGCNALITVNLPVGSRQMEAMSGGIVSTAFTGYDHIDLKAAAEWGVAVSNVPGYSSRSVAELAFALSIMSLRDPRLEHGRELCGKTVGIIGTGSIGFASAGLFRAASCEVLGFSRSEKPGFPGKYTDLEFLLRKSDVVSLHLPLTRETEHFMDSEKLGMMKRGAILVNTARGALVNQIKLQELLLSGSLGGAGLDVTTPEPLPQSNILHRIPGVVITPHTGFNTVEALERRTVEALRNVAAWDRGERRNRVD